MGIETSGAKAFMVTMVAGRYGPDNPDDSDDPGQSSSSPAVPSTNSQPSEPSADKSPSVPPASPVLDGQTLQAPVPAQGSQTSEVQPPATACPSMIQSSPSVEVAISDYNFLNDAGEGDTQPVARPVSPFVGDVRVGWTRLTGGNYDFPRMTLGVSGFVGLRRFDDSAETLGTKVKGLAFGVEGLKSGPGLASPDGRLVYAGVAKGWVSTDPIAHVALLASTGYAAVQELGASNNPDDTLTSSGIFVGADFTFLILNGSIKVVEPFPEDGQVQKPSVALSGGITF